jgi:hypothetical protein
MTIREKRTYRADGWDTFEEYCQERWGWSRVHAHRLIEASEVATGLLPMGNTAPLPANERQARELAPLRDNPAAKVREAVDHAREIPVPGWKDFPQNTCNVSGHESKQSIHPSTCIPPYPHNHTPTDPTTYLATYLATYLSIYLSIYVPIY